MSEKKSTLDEAIAKLKALLFSNEKPEPEPIVTTEQTFKDAKLNDGTTIVRYEGDVLAVGAKVNILDEKGAEMPLPIGDYILEDGSTFSVVDEMGSVDNVVLAPEAPAEDTNTGEVVATETPAPAANPNPVPSAPKRVIKSQVEEHVFSIELEDYEVIKVDLSSMFKKLADENESLRTLNKEMFSVIEKLADMPTAAPTESKKKFSVSEAKMDFKKSMAELEEKLSKENN